MKDSQRIAPSKKQKSPEGEDHIEENVTALNQSVSIADELQKLANLKEEGVLTEEEFNKMKQDLIRNNKR